MVFCLLQPSLKGIAHLNSLCQSLVDSGSSFADLIRPYHSRLRVCQEVCEKALKERLDICTTFVDFEDAAEEVRSRVGCVRVLCHLACSRCVCMYVCMYVCKAVCSSCLSCTYVIRTYVLEEPDAYVRICTYVHMYVHIRFVRMCLHVCMYVWTYVCMFVRTYVYTYSIGIYICACMAIYITWFNL